MTLEKICLVLAILIFSSVFLLKFSKRFNVPTLIIYLGVGMLAGSDGIGGLEFNDPEVAKFFGSIALCFILFSGAFSTKKEDILPVWKEGLLLSFIGVTVNTLLVAIPIYFFTPFDYLGALLFGAIVSSTDAAAVMSILSFSKLDIKKRVGGILKLESGTNDPMANVIILLLIGVITQGNFSLLHSITFLTSQVIMGTLMGYLLSKLTLFMLKKFEIKMQELHQMIIIASILATFSLTNIFYGNGFLAIYILGLELGNSKIDYKKNITRFFTSTSWILEAGMFVALGLLVFPTHLLKIWKVGIGAAFILTFIARPLSVFITLFRSKLKDKEKLFVAWGGLKGAVPIVFATFPLVEGIENSELIFNLVFFVVLLSVIFQGISLPFASEYLGLKNDEIDYLEQGDLESFEYFEEKLIKVRVQKGNLKKNIKVSELKLPREVLLILIIRDKEKLLPNGNTPVYEGDVLYILSDSLEELRNYIERLKEINPIDIIDETLY